MAYTRPAPESIPCFTFGDEYNASHDVRVARKIAKACGQKYEPIYLGKKYLDTYPERLQEGIYITDGLANATNVDGLYLNRLVREYGITKVTGKFGSQVFGSISALRDRSPTEGLVEHDFTPMLADAAKRFDFLCGGNDLSNIIFKEIPWYWSGYTVAELCHVTVRSPFLDNELIALRYRAPQYYISSRKFHFNAIYSKAPDLAVFRTDMGEYGANTPMHLLPKKWLIYLSNMASKAYNWDRMPYGLHHIVPRFDGILSLLGIDKPLRNITFFRHYRIWFRQELADFIQDVLLDPKTLGRAYWNSKILQKIVLDHIAGRRNNLAEIRKVLTLEMIERSLVENM
jgi:asparagine synthase (glutamine-hydrolysing)